MDWHDVALMLAGVVIGFAIAAYFRTNREGKGDDDKND